MNIISVYQGNYLVQPITIVDEAGAAIDLDGCALLLTVRDMVGTQLITKTSSAGIAVISAAAGSIEVEFAHADTTALASGTYAFELLLTDIVGNPYTVLTGTFRVLSNLTKGEST